MNLPWWFVFCYMFAVLIDFERAKLASGATFRSEMLQQLRICFGIVPLVGGMLGMERV